MAAPLTSHRRCNADNINEVPVFVAQASEIGSDIVISKHHQLWQVRGIQRRPVTPPRLVTRAVSEPLWFVRTSLPSPAAWRLPRGVGPSCSIDAARQLDHPFTQQLPMHPLYERALQSQTVCPEMLGKLVSGRLAFWALELERLQSHRESWVASLPEHCAAVYTSTGLNGPGLAAIHAHMISKGYSDTALFEDVSCGLPSHGNLPVTGLWPRAADHIDRMSELQPLGDTCAGTRTRVAQWQRSRGVDPHSQALLEKFLVQVRSGCAAELSRECIESGGMRLVHPTFTIAQGSKLREISDATAGELNPCTVSSEKLRLPGVEDPLNFACRLLQLRSILGAPWGAPVPPNAPRLTKTHKFKNGQQ